MVVPAKGRLGFRKIIFGKTIRAIVFAPVPITPRRTPSSKASEDWRIQDALRNSDAATTRASVLDCGGPPPLFPGA